MAAGPEYLIRLKVTGHARPEVAGPFFQYAASKLQDGKIHGLLFDMREMLSDVPETRDMLADFLRERQAQIAAAAVVTSRVGVALIGTAVSVRAGISVRSFESVEVAEEWLMTFASGLRR